MNYREEAKKQIDEIADKIDILESKKESVNAEARAEYHRQLAEFKEVRQKLESQLKKLSDSSEEKWKDAKDQFDEAADSIRLGFTKLTSMFN